MRPETYDLLVRVVNGESPDAAALEQVRELETPDVVRKIDLVLKRFQPQPWLFDNSPFRSPKFRAESHPRIRLDQVVMTSLLFFADIASNEQFHRSVFMPGSSEGSRYWEQLLKYLYYSVLTLAYDLRWNPERLFRLDECVLALTREGRGEALREFLASACDVRVDAEAARSAEKEFHDYYFHRTVDFGPYFWKLVHWMAELFPLRRTGEGDDDDVRLAKVLWRDFLVHSLYRLLGCPHCIDHYKRVLETGFRDRIMETTDDRNLGRVLFDLHNRVNVETFKQSYAEEEYEKDAEFMRLAAV